MTADITRKIIKVGSRHVHVRFCGNGPPALILHQSPRSSEEMEPLMQAWSNHFTCIAPDHPGYGLSDPLPMDAPNIEDFADAVAELVDALNIEKLPIYGHHTGAIIAMALGAKHPNRAAALVANGVLVNTQADRDDLARNYLPPFTPSHDASHLLALWWRMREQSLFFPWYNRKAEARMVYGIRPAQDIHPSCMDFLAAGDNYRRGYGAALATVTQDYLDRLNVPTLVTAAQPDPLWVDVGKLSVDPPLEVKRFDSLEPLLAASLEFMLAASASDPFDSAALPQLGQRRITSGSTSICLEKADAPTAILVPDLGMEVACEGTLLEDSSASIYAINPAGHGLSQADATLPALDDVDVLMSFGFGVVHLPALMERYPSARVIAADLLCPQTGLDTYLESYIPDLSPQDNGGHLATAFLAARSAKVFWPWFETSHENAIPGEHLLDADHLHIDTRALLRGWQAAKALLPQVSDALGQIATAQGDVTIALPQWAESRSDIRKNFGSAAIMYYALDDREKALNALL